ncbi:MAG TPA: transporter [Gemmatimonadaceae bacterium]|nr:transporter [Gemmatimonadaceae bacterium]
MIALMVSGRPASAQGGLRDLISQLFIFGPGEDPLYLAGSGSASNPVQLQAHGRHFVPSSAIGNSSVITFITDALSGNVANLPIGSTSGGETFRFVGGVPVRTSTSAGPIFAERAQTLGRGRILAGVSRSSFRFTTLRGIDMKDIELAFTHENVDFPGCAAAFGGDCALYGVPSFENDVMEFHLSIDLNVNVSSIYLTYGLNDRVDLGFVVPVVQAELQGASTAQMRPFGGTTAAHFFAGTNASPVLSADRQSQGSATGLGDVAVRVKSNFRNTPTANFGFLVDARFPTGSKKDLLGSGSFAMRGIAIFGSRFGDFSPHANIGYLYRAGARQNDAVLGTAGFDHRLAERVTLAADLVSELQVGDSNLELPATVRYQSPFLRTVTPTDIPDTRDDIINGSFGVKLAPSRNGTIVLNTLFPLNRGGLRADIVYTAGLEYTF